ncbi:hypothetical protein M2158_006735 [Streptomyces sp. SAI-144]|nr:hypothetical protein [Streptomyces sp. SAI-144]
MPWVRAQAGAVLGVDDGELQAELLGHLVAPLEGEAGRTDDHGAAGPAAQHELLHDEAGLDGLAEADVVGEEEVDAGRADRAGDRLQLVRLDGDAGAERGLEGFAVGGRDGGPADGIEEGGEAVRGVVGARGGVGQGAGGQDAAAGLDLPDHREGVAEAAVGDGLEVDQGRWTPVLLAVGRGQGRLDAGDHPGLAAHLDQVPFFGERLRPRPLGLALSCWRHGRCSPRCSPAVVRRQCPVSCLPSGTT